MIFAIFLRDIKSKFNDKFGISWSIVSPLSFILVMSLIRGGVDGHQTHTMSTFFFMVYGMMQIQLFLMTFSAVALSISRNKALFAFRQVKPISAVISSAVFEMLVKIFVFFVVLIIAFFLNMEIRLDDLLMLIICFLQLWVFAASLGIIFAIFRAFIPEIEKVRGMLVRPLFFISGVFFSLKDIPKEYWPYLNWNPILHSIELTRDAAYSSYQADGVSYFYVNFSCFAVLLIALSLYKVFWKSAISR